MERGDAIDVLRAMVQAHVDDPNELLMVNACFTLIDRLLTGQEETNRTLRIIAANIELMSRRS